MATKQTRLGGFTLIELLVSVVIIGILVGAGIAAYRRFNDKQRVLAAGHAYESLLRMAQKKAKAGDKPSSGCATLKGYRVGVTNNGSKAILSVLCDDGTTVIYVSELNFDSDITYTSTANIDFLGLSGGVIGATSVNVSNAAGTTLFQVDVGESGSISGSEP